MGIQRALGGAPMGGGADRRLLEDQQCADPRAIHAQQAHRATGAGRIEANLQMRKRKARFLGAAFYVSRKLRSSVEIQLALDDVIGLVGSLEVGGNAVAGVQLGDAGEGHQLGNMRRGEAVHGHKLAQQRFVDAELACFDCPCLRAHQIVFELCDIRV